MNDTNWARIHSTTEPHLAEIVRSVLEGEGIRCVIMDKRDKAYTVFGDIEVYVQRDNVVLAKRLIEKAKL